MQSSNRICEAMNPKNSPVPNSPVPSYSPTEQIGVILAHQLRLSINRVQLANAHILLSKQGRVGDTGLPSFLMTVT